MDIVLEAKNLTKVYGSGEGTVHALRGVSVGIERGSFTAIIGKSGCGKTTVINLLMRFYDVNSGSIQVSGTDIRDMTRSRACTTCRTTSLLGCAAQSWALCSRPSTFCRSTR